MTFILSGALEHGQEVELYADAPFANNPNVRLGYHFRNVVLDARSSKQRKIDEIVEAPDTFGTAGLGPLPHDRVGRHGFDVLGWVRAVGRAPDSRPAAFRGANG